MVESVVTLWFCSHTSLVPSLIHVPRHVVERPCDESQHSAGHVHCSACNNHDRYGNRISQFFFGTTDKKDWGSVEQIVVPEVTKSNLRNTENFLPPDPPISMRAYA